MLTRVAQLIKSKKMTASEFADVIGVQRSSVSHVLSGRNKPSLDFVTKILEAFPEVDADWLISAKGKMFLDDGYRDDSTTVELQTSMDLDTDTAEQTLRGKENKAVDKKRAGSKRVTTGSKSIERIVLFYNDGTFTEFTPD